MNETMLGLMAVFALGVCLIDCLAWMLGGRDGKWKRRFLGAGIQSLGLNVISAILGTWTWQYVLALAPEIGSRTMGYSADKGRGKLIPRAVFALCSLCAGAVLCWGAGFNGNAVTLLICQAVASVVSIILGVKNPLPAAVEEVFVCFSLKYINYGYIFINYLNH